MKFCLLTKWGAALLGILVIGNVWADTFMPIVGLQYPSGSSWTPNNIDFEISPSFSAINYNYMTKNNRKIYAAPTGINYIFSEASQIANQVVGWAIIVELGAGWHVKTGTAYGDVFYVDSKPNIGYLLKINGVDISANTGFLSSGMTSGSLNGKLSANVQVAAVEIEEGKGDIDRNIPIFKFAVIPAYYSLEQGVMYNRDNKYNWFTISNNQTNIWGTPYISFCQTINSPDPSNVTLANITTKEFLSSNRSQVYSTFKLSVKDCGAKNTQDPPKWWRNDIQSVYVTFSDANNNGSTSTILKNTGTATGVGFSIYPEGSEQPVKFSATGNVLYGTPEDNNPLKSDGTATKMNYSKGETQTNDKGVTFQLGTAEKTFRVYYARDPSQGEEVKAGSVVGKATFTFSYQ